MAPELDRARTGDANRRLTEPLGTVVSFFLTLGASLLVIGLVLMATNHGGSLFGFGAGPVCADVPLNGLSQSGDGALVAHLRPQAYAGTGAQVMLCANRPTPGQRALGSLTEAPTVILYMAVLVLLGQLLRTIRAAGPFAVVVARRLRFLAWFVLAGSLAVAAGQSVAQSAFASTVVTDSVPVTANAVSAVLDGLLLPLLIACGLLTLARVIRVGTQLSDDLAGTV